MSIPNENEWLSEGGDRVVTIDHGIPCYVGTARLVNFACGRQGPEVFLQVGFHPVRGCLNLDLKWSGGLQGGHRCGRGYDQKIGRGCVSAQWNL